MRIVILLALLTGMWNCTGKAKQADQNEAPAIEEQEMVVVDTTENDQDEEVEEDTIPALSFEGAEWVFHSYQQGGAITRPVKDSKLTVTFSSGKVSGYSGCNSYNGAFSATEAGGIEISDLASTKRLCEGLMGQEANYLELLGKATAWKMDRVELRLTSGNTTLIYHNIPKNK